MPASAMMLSQVAVGGGGGGAFGFYRTVTIDHTKVGSVDHTDFPVLVSGTYSYLATVANSGKVQNASGYDVAFFSDSALTTQLKHETERYVASTGEVVYWVKVPSVSHTSDTVIYMAYGNTGISTDQSDKTNVWDTYYKGVYHLGDGSTLSGLDSTANANDMTLVNTPTAGTGKVGGGATFVAASFQRMERSTNASLSPGANFSLSAWVKPNNISGDVRAILGKCVSGGFPRDFDLDIETGGHVRFYFSAGGGFQGFSGSTVLSSGGTTWYHVAATYNGTIQRLFINGAADGTNSYSGTPDNTAGNAAIGRLGSGDNYADGMIDEARITNGLARVGDWFLAEYNNQNSPSTFYAVGSEVPV